jgi:hypothetical protein
MKQTNRTERRNSIIVTVADFDTLLSMKDRRSRKIKEREFDHH